MLDDASRPHCAVVLPYGGMLDNVLTGLRSLAAACPHVAGAGALAMTVISVIGGVRAVRMARPSDLFPGYRTMSYGTMS